MAGEFQIEAARIGDAGEVAAIYAHHVLHGTATFETEPPSETEMAARMKRLLDMGCPWLVARAPCGDMLGYAYAGPFHTRSAYSLTCENTVYLRHDRLGQGIGSALLARLIAECEARGFRQMVALIAGSEPASMALHKRFGFTEAGHLKSVGRKFGRWLDVLYLQCALGQGDLTAPGEEPA